MEGILGENDDNSVEDEPEPSALEKEKSEFLEKLSQLTDFSCKEPDDYVKHPLFEKFMLQFNKSTWEIWEPKEGEILALPEDWQLSTKGCFKAIFLQEDKFKPVNAKTITMPPQDNIQFNYNSVPRPRFYTAYFSPPRPNFFPYGIPPFCFRPFLPFPPFCSPDLMFNRFRYCYNSRYPNRFFGSRPSHYYTRHPRNYNYRRLRF